MAGSEGGELSGCDKPVGTGEMDSLDTASEDSGLQDWLKKIRTTVQNITT
ncbi:MAG: hypothetical protein MUP03_01250 [Anaerolineales bacterium]|nr:hypothetical protein [Anaerolineales bacterium]